MRIVRPNSNRRSLAAIRSGDALMVKASAGSRMGPIVKALVRHHSTESAAEPARARG